MFKIVNKEEYESLKKMNKFLSNNYRASSLCLGFEKAIIAIMKKCNLESIELENDYFFLDESITVEYTPNNSTIIKIHKIEKADD